MEEWRAIDGHPGYEVSDQGRVRSIDRWINYSDGRRARFKGVLLKPGKVGKNYWQVALGGEAPNNYVHVLVATAFHGEPKPDQEVRHLDNNPANNVVTNLCWGTRSENQSDRIVHGTHGRGERNPRAKLTREAVLEIRAGKLPAKVLMKKYGISNSHLYGIRNGTFWSWL